MTGLLLLTIRELRARKVVVGLFVVATAVWLAFALALQLDVVDGSLAGARLFGSEVPIIADSAEAADEAQAQAARAAAAQAEARASGGETVTASVGAGLNPLEGLVFGAQAFVAGAAYWVGILLCLFATGGLVASLVEKGQADLLVSKPMSRSALLFGRLAGVGLVTLGLVAYLLGAVWLVMSLKTGVWNVGFLLAIPTVWTMFMVLYGVVTLVSVWSGSGALALIATLGLVVVTLVLAIPGLALSVDAAVRPVVQGLYYALPRFGSVGTDLVPHLATGFDAPAPGAQPGLPAPVAALIPLATSVAFGLACYAGAFALFARRDY